MKQYHSNHGRPFYKHNAEQGRTQVVVSRCGEQVETLLLSGGPGQALATAHEHYAFRARMRTLDPGIYRLSACGETISLEVGDQDADSGAVEGGTARERGSSRSTARAEHATGRSSALLDGLRPRYAKHRRAG